VQGLPTYLTAADVADGLRVSEKSVYRWAASDPTMPALRIGGVVRFPRERLERWLRDREQGRGRAHPTDSPVTSGRKPAPDQVAG
jgi:excisionase family DNA binding protein